MNNAVNYNRGRIFVLLFGFVLSFLSICASQNYRSLRLEDYVAASIGGGMYLFLLPVLFTLRYASQKIVLSYHFIVVVFLLSTVISHFLGHTGNNKAWGFSWIPAMFVASAEYVIALALNILAFLVYFVRKFAVKAPKSS